MYCSNELNLMLIHKIGYEINLSNLIPGVPDLASLSLVYLICATSWRPWPGFSPPGLHDMVYYLETLTWLFSAWFHDVVYYMENLTWSRYHVYLIWSSTWRPWPGFSQPGLHDIVYYLETLTWLLSAWFTWYGLIPGNPDLASLPGPAPDKV